MGWGKPIAANFKIQGVCVATGVRFGSRGVCVATGDRKGRDGVNPWAGASPAPTSHLRDLLGQMCRRPHATKRALKFALMGQGPSCQSSDLSCTSFVVRNWQRHPNYSSGAGG